MKRKSKSNKDKKGAYHALKDFLPKTMLFVPSEYDVDEYLEAYKEKLINRQCKSKAT